MSYYESDAFFARGKTHMVCEDFAVAGRAECGASFAIVSDGCSSSKDTDTGARILAHSAALEMNWVAGAGWGAFKEHESKIISNAWDATRPIYLNGRCLDATLLTAHWAIGPDDTGGVAVNMRGDGVVVVRERDSGDYTIFVTDHEHNAPRYLSYDLDPDRLEGYLKKYGEKHTTRMYGVGCGEFQYDQKKLNERHPEDISPWPRMKHEGKTFEFEGHPGEQWFERDRYDLVMVLSDGVLTFQRPVVSDTSKTYEDVPVTEVVEQLLKIKTTSKNFLKRRCHRFLNRFCKKHGWEHTDDFSVAAIWTGD